MDEPTSIPPESQVIELPALPAAPHAPKPWGFWATLGWFLLAFFGMSLVTAVIMDRSGFGGDAFNGDVLALGGFLFAALVIPVFAGCIRLRRGWTVREYVALVPAPGKQIVAWTAIAVGWSLAFDLVQTAFGRDVVPDFMFHAYYTASNKTLFFVYVLIGAPFVEEFSIRGFLLRGWAQSRMGAPGAVLLTSLLFAALHSQYDPVGRAFTGSLGILLALARLTTGSIVPGIVAHATLNFVASLEMLWLADHSGGVLRV